MDNTLSPGVKEAGDVEFRRLELIDTKNKNTRYNLIGSFVDFTIYEDLFSPVLTGYVALIETQNLITSIPIVGEELIYAEFSTPSLQSISCYFQITKVALREHDDKKTGYMLELLSYDGYVDLNKRLSTSYSGNTGDLVKSIYQSSFNKDLVDADKSDNIIKFVSPYWGPFKTINHVVSRAVFPNNKMTTPNFLFYESNKGHKYKSLSTLINQKPFTEFFFDKNVTRRKLPDGTSTRDINREYASIKELYFVGAQDYVNSMINGAFNHKVMGVDLFRKKFDVKTYHFTNDFNKTAHLSPFPFVTKTINKSSGLLTLRNTYPNLFDGVSDISDEIIAKRMSLLAQLETYKLNIVVHGRTDFEVGMVISIWLNEFKSIDKTDKFRDSYDPIYSGKYLITAISHRFTQAKHEMLIECIKDSSLLEIKNK